MTAGDFFRILSRRPERRWPDAFIHHGARAGLLLVLAIVTSLMFPIAPLPDFPVVEKGAVPETDVIAEIPFPIRRSPTELARAREEAASAVNPIFAYDSTAVDTMLADVDRFFARVDSAASAGGGSAAVRRRLRDLLIASGLTPGSDAVDLLLDPARRQQLRRSIRSVVLEELPRGIARSPELEEAGSAQIRVRLPSGDRIVRVDSVLTLRDLYSLSRSHLVGSISPAYEELQRLLLVRFAVPSLRADPAATAEQRGAARAAVPLITGNVLRGERIITAHEPVTEDQLERFRAYLRELELRGSLNTDGGLGARGIGAFLFNLIPLALFGVLLYFYRPEVYRDLRHVSLLAFLTLAVVGAAGIIAAYSAPAALIPIAFPALVIATLWDGRLALSLSLIIAVLLSGQTPFLGIAVLLTLVTGGAVASLSVRVVRRRAQTWVFIALIASAYVLTSIVLGLLHSWPLQDIAEWSGWGALNALGSAFMAMGFLPVFEGYTRITTDQTLLELADSNRPLLRRLSREAPGTYAHSINVANLAEAAAGAIGANALLTRVGVYYHDVGKIGRPHFFIENQRGGRNPHDKLKPSTSAAVIRNHVLEGVKLAEDAKLPGCVKDFILEHHGTQAISFFYDRACEADPDADLDPRDYAYPGPKPQSKETAIVLLADSVESAARVLPDPSPENIGELVDRIVRGKMDAGQLEDTPLTMADLTAIKDQFVTVLTGVYHQRIDYPAPREENESETPPRRAGAGVP